MPKPKKQPTAADHGRRGSQIRWGDRPKTVTIRVTEAARDAVAIAAATAGGDRVRIASDALIRALPF